MHPRRPCSAIAVAPFLHSDWLSPWNGATFTLVFPPVPVRFPIGITHHDQNQLWKEKHSLVYTSTSWAIIERSQAKNLESGTEAEVMEEYSLQAHSPWLAHPASLYTMWPPFQGWHWPHCSGPFLPYKSQFTQLTRIEGQSDRGVFSDEFLSFQVTLMSSWQTN